MVVSGGSIIPHAAISTDMITTNDDEKENSNLVGRDQYISLRKTLVNHIYMDINNLK